MAHATLGCLNARIDPMADRATLHEDDRMMSVFTDNGRGQTHDVPRFRPPSDKLEACRGQVMAFIDDQMAVVGDGKRRIGDACKAKIKDKELRKLFADI